MKKIKIVNYFAPCDEQGNFVGHHSKSIMEYYNLLSNFRNVEIELYCPKEFQSNLPDVDLNYVKYSFRLGNKNIFSKIKDVIKRIINIDIIVRASAENDIIWFSSVDYVLYLYLIFFRYKLTRKSLKILATVYQIDYKNYLKNLLTHTGIKMLDIVILTNKNLGLSTKHIFMPDYFFNEELYKDYRSNEKIYDYICVGLMKNDKELFELVDSFNALGFNLKIIGKFEDKNVFEKLMDTAFDNIEIQDTYLDNHEYYELISKSKYVCLPYKSSLYSHKTTGVLLETIFLGSIPITPNSILADNEVSGIGYENINELTTLLKDADYDFDAMVGANEKLVESLNYQKFLAEIRRGLDIDV